MRKKPKRIVRKQRGVDVQDGNDQAVPKAADEPWYLEVERRLRTMGIKEVMPLKTDGSDPTIE